MQPTQVPRKSSKVIFRYPYKEVMLKRSMYPFYFSQIFLGFVASIASVFSFSIVAIFDIEIHYFLIAFGFIVLLFIINFFLSIFRYRSFYYVLIPGYLQNTQGKFLDQISGKLVIYDMWLGERKTTISMIYIGKVEVIQSIIGRIFDFGRIYIEEIDKATEITNFSLIGIQRPDEVAGIIQKMVDFEMSQSQPVR